MVQHRVRNVSFRGGKFNTQVAEGGSGENLLYLHGDDGFTSWTPFLDALAQNQHVYAPAHPGVGDSTGLEHLDDLWDLVLFYEELVQELGLERTAIIGHSYGGMIAAELAAHRPERVSRLVLASSMGLWLEEHPVVDFFMLTHSERAALLWHDPSIDVAKAYMAAPEDPEAKREADLDRTKTLMAVGKFAWPIPDKGLAKRAHRITMPTLLLWGDSDQIVHPDYGLAFQDLLPNATLKILENCGHLPQIECQQEFLEAVQAFLRG